MSREFGTSRSRSGTSSLSHEPALPDVQISLLKLERLLLDYVGQMSEMKRRPRRNRVLTQDQWSGLRGTVFRRDARVVLDYAAKRQGMRKLEVRGTSLDRPLPWCPAVVMDPSQWGRCHGTWQLDHVKEEPRTGVKADDDEEHLIALCAAHDERGMKAGFQWNTANREAEREYLAAYRSK